MKKKPQGLEDIDALARYAHSKRGNLAEVMKLYKERTGIDVHHPTMIRWLHVEPSLRTEPLLTTGLVLIEIAHKLCIHKKRDDKFAAIRQVIECVEARCMAAEGDVTPTCKEITDAELRTIWKLAGGK